MARKFKFQVVAAYSSYTDVIEAVHMGKIDYGIIDSLLWYSITYPNLEILDVNIEPYLENIFQDQLGTDKEYYAMAVSAKVNNTIFLNLLNEIIDSPEPEAQSERIELEEKHKAENRALRKHDIYNVMQANKTNALGGQKAPFAFAHYAFSGDLQRYLCRARTSRRKEI